MNVTVEKHNPSTSPFALSACDNAFIEEHNAKEREMRKKVQAHEFHHSTRIMLLSKMQEIEKDKQRANYETVSVVCSHIYCYYQAEKIKKLLVDTVEFS